MVPALYVALFVMFVALFAMALNLKIRGQELVDLRVLQRQQERRLVELEPRIQQLQQENAALVKSRLPGLRPLDIDKIITLNQAFVKSITFSLSGKGGNKLYEYRMLLDNQEGRVVKPAVEILMFDRNGIQLGTARMTAEGNEDKPAR